MDPKICKKSRNDRMNENCDDRKNSGIDRWLEFKKVKL